MTMTEAVSAPPSRPPATPSTCPTASRARRRGAEGIAYGDPQRLHLRLRRGAREPRPSRRARWWRRSGPRRRGDGGLKAGPAIGRYRDHPKITRFAPHLWDRNGVMAPSVSSGGKHVEAWILWIGRRLGALGRRPDGRRRGAGWSAPRRRRRATRRPRRRVRATPGHRATGAGTAAGTSGTAAGGWPSVAAITGCRRAGSTPTRAHAVAGASCPATGRGRRPGAATNPTSDVSRIRQARVRLTAPCAC